MTEIQYKGKLERLKKLCPKHQLIPILEKGYSTINSLYLKTALDTIQSSMNTQTVSIESEPKESRESRNEKATQRNAIGSEKELLNKYLAKKYHYRNQMNRLSNEFHVKKTVEERKLISIQINEIENKFKEIKKQIDFFDNNGYFKDNIISEKISLYNENYILPNSKEELQKALNVAKVSISRFEKKLNEIATKPFSAKNEIRKTEIDKIILIWKDRKIKIQNKINNDVDN